MPDRSLLILYGSQTGTAQEVAETIARQAKNRHFKIQCCSMDDYDRVSIHLFFSKSKKQT